MPQGAQAVDLSVEGGDLLSLLRYEQLVLMTKASSLLQGEGELLAEHCRLFLSGGKLALEQLGEWRGGGRGGLHVYEVALV